MKVASENKSLPTVAGWMWSWNSGYYRGLLPLRTLERQGLIRAAPFVQYDWEQDRPWADAVILQRSNDPWHFEMIDALQRNGVLVVHDEDLNVLRMRHGEAVLKTGYPGENLRYADVARDMHVDAARWFFAQRKRNPALYAKRLKDIGRQLRHVSDPDSTEAIPRARMLERLARGIASVNTEEEAVALARWFCSISMYESTLRAADLLTVSTEELASILRPYNPHIAVLPNCIDLSLPAFSQRQVGHDGLILGWAGSNSHERDLKLIAPALKQIMQEYGNPGSAPRVRLMLGGEPRIRGCLLGLPGMEAFAEKVQRYIDEQDEVPRIGFETVESDCGRYLWRTWTQDVDSVPGMYRDVDIALVPNALTSARSRYRGDVKGVEAAGMAVPMIGSAIASYQRHRGPGTGAILVRNRPGEWYDQIKRLILDLGLRQQLSEEALAFAETRDINLWAPKWLEAYEQAAKRTGRYRFLRPGTVSYKWPKYPSDRLLYG